MDIEKLRKRQTIKVLLSEVIMVCAVVGVVTLLMLIVSGYWISQDFTVERQGMFQINSIPTGADVLIDGESGWMQRTNMNKIVSSGEHTISLAKEGYDTWSKTINVSEGLMYRVGYPRLFLQDREKEQVIKFEEGANVTVSPDTKTMLIMNPGVAWQLAKISDNKVSYEPVDASSVFANIVTSGEVRILSTVWNSDNEKMIIKIQNGSNNEWVAFDVKHPEKSVNLSKKYGMSFDSMIIRNGNFDDLFAMYDTDLYKLSLSQPEPKLVAHNILTVRDYRSDLIVVAKDEDGKKYIGEIKNVDNGEIVKIIETEAEKIFAVSGNFYENLYLYVVEDARVSLYNIEKQLIITGDRDYKPVLSEEIGFIPNYCKVGHDGDYLFMKNGHSVAVLDMESNKIIEYNVENEKIGWLDEHLLYTFNDEDETVIYDYDGLNRRVLVRGALSTRPVLISDDKWLYYIDNNSGWLVRENLLPR